jgi:hypothetical protein
MVAQQPVDLDPDWKYASVDIGNRNSGIPPFSKGICAWSCVARPRIGTGWPTKLLKIPEPSFRGVPRTR